MGTKNVILKISAGIVLLSVLLLLVSCSSKNQQSDIPKGYQLISDEGLDYRFYVPVTWIADQNKGVSAAYVSDKDRSSVSFTAFELSDSMIEISASGTPEQQLTDFWNFYEDIFKKTFNDMEYITNGENRLVSSCASKTYVYTATVTGISCKYMQVTTVKDGTVYLFTYTASEDNFDSHLSEVEGILTNIVL